MDTIKMNLTKYNLLNALKLLVIVLSALGIVLCTLSAFDAVQAHSRTIRSCMVFEKYSGATHDEAIDTCNKRWPMKYP